MEKKLLNITIKLMEQNKQQTAVMSLLIELYGENWSTNVLFQDFVHKYLEKAVLMQMVRKENTVPLNNTTTKDMEQNKQTAVEWFFMALQIRGLQPNEEYVKVYNEAKEKEKYQIIDAVDSVQIVNRYYYKNGEHGDDLLGKEVPTSEDGTYYGLSTNGDKYYNETYGGDK